MNEDLSVEDVCLYLQKESKYTLSENTINILKENEVDGLVLLNMSEDDFFKMFEKVGIARKLFTLVGRIKEQSLAKPLLSTAYLDIAQADKTSECSLPIIDVSCENSSFEVIPQSTAENKMTDSVPSCSSSVVLSCSTPSSVPVDYLLIPGSSQSSMNASPANSYLVPFCSSTKDSFLPSLPKFSPPIQHLLDVGNIVCEWNTFISETGNHVVNFPSFCERNSYDNYGRLMFSKYPCIQHNGPQPYSLFNKSLSNKVRQIRLRRKRTGEKMAHKSSVDSEIKSSKKKCNRLLDFVELPDQGLDSTFKEEQYEDIVVNLKNLCQLPKKEQDRPQVMKLIRCTIKKRRTWIQGLNNAVVGQIVEKFPHLKDPELIDLEFSCLYPELHANFDSRWQTYMKHLAKLVNIERSRTDAIETEEELSSLLNLQAKLTVGRRALVHKMLLSIQQAPTESSLKDPPRLEAQKMEDWLHFFILADGEKLTLETNKLSEAVKTLIQLYYVWHLQYPMQYQLLGFLQYYILGDIQNIFSKSVSYSKFEKEFEKILQS